MTGTINFREVPLAMVLLSVPVFVYSLATGMTLVVKLVVGTFYGHPRCHDGLAG